MYKIVEVYRQVTNSQLGKLAHYGFDLVLISIILAAVNRNTGLQFDTSSFSSVDFRRWFGNYLSFGERCYDATVSLLRMSGYFKQRNFGLDYAKKESTKFLKEQTGLDFEQMRKNDQFVTRNFDLSIQVFDFQLD